jgi:hypothetical protein
MTAPSDPSQPTIHELIERSSLGTPEAKRIRESADPALVERVMERAKGLFLAAALEEEKGNSST